MPDLEAVNILRLEVRAPIQQEPELLESKVGMVRVAGLTGHFTVMALARAPFDPEHSLIVTLAPTRDATKEETDAN